MRKILSDLVGVAGTDCPLLIEGESGTGKELLARIAHELSCSNGAPFEAISCGAIPDTLIESELFGHVKGAFTGALRDHRGVFARGRGGTVFLDEIGEMPPNMQVKLLRVLQEGSFVPVGGEQLHRVQSRVIAATNRDLQRASENGHFRQDLFYRLNVFPIRLPPLRERADDIPLLVEHFLSRHAAEMGRPTPVVRTAAMRRLRVYSYPGNVRELQNIVRALLVEVRDGGEILDRHVVAVFSRHRVGDAAVPSVRTGSAEAEKRPAPDAIGRWVVDELRRYYFNLALAERMLDSRSRAAADRRSIPVCSRSGLTYYLQGECFRTLAAAHWDAGVAAERLAGQSDHVDRVRRKLDAFLRSAVRAMRGAGGDRGDRRAALHRRFAKLPAGYGPDLDRLAEAFDAGRFGADGAVRRRSREK